MEDVTRSILEKLEAASCSYEVLEHEPVFTMEDVERNVVVPSNSRVKTMVIAFRGDFGVEPVLCGLRADGRLDVKKLAELLNTTRSRVSMMDPQTAETLLRMPKGAIGLIAPFSSPKVIVSAVFEGETFLCFGVGRNDRTLKLSVTDLARVADVIFADIERG